MAHMTRGPSNLTFPLWKLFAYVGGAGILFAMCSGLLLCPPAPKIAAARRSQCSNNLKQLAHAVQSYATAHGALPPAAGAASAEPSWRVAVAIFLGADLAEAGYSPSRPWDHPSNRTADAPRVFQCPSTTKRDGEPHRSTHYVAVTGDQTFWSGDESVSSAALQQNPDKILLVEIPDSDILWNEPRDVTFEEFIARIMARLPHERVFNYATGDGRVVAFNVPEIADRHELRTYLEEKLRPMVTIER